MAKFLKGLCSNAAKLSKQLDSKCDLTVSQNHTSTTSLYKAGKENKPLATLTINGNGKISLLRLIAYVIFIISALGFVMFIIHSVKKWIRALSVKCCAHRSRKDK